MDSARPEGTVSRAEAVATIVAVLLASVLGAGVVTYVLGAVLGR